MPKFAVYVSWKMVDTIFVDAETKNKANEFAHHNNLENGVYLDESFRVDAVEELRPTVRGIKV